MTGKQAQMSGTSVFDLIRLELRDNDIVLFMKGSAVFPQCGFSAAVVQLLDNLGVAYKDVDVLSVPDLRQGIKDFTSWPTIPQLYIRGQFVGGADIVREMYASGELQKLLKDEGLL
jgi:monothiol glutaredoxin